MSDYPMLISNKLHSFRNFAEQSYKVCPGLTARNRSFFAIARLYESPSTIGFPQKKEMPD